MCIYIYIYISYIRKYQNRKEQVLLYFYDNVLCFEAYTRCQHRVSLWFMKNFIFLPVICGRQQSNKHNPAGIA